MQATEDQNSGLFEVVAIKKILVWNLLIYIYLQCVSRSSWSATTLATLLYSVHFESKTTRKRKRKRKGNSISLVPTTAALPQISQKKVIRRRCSLVRRQHSVSFSEFHSVFQLILDMTCLALKMLSQHCHRLTWCNIFKFLPLTFVHIMYLVSDIEAFCPNCAKIASFSKKLNQKCGYL